MNTEEMRAWIDKASYQQLLQKWRFEPTGSPWFTGEMGDYYSARIRQLRREVGNEKHVEASKAIGW